MYIHLDPPEAAKCIQLRKNYEAFFNTLDDFLFVLDMEGRIRQCNETVFRRLKYTPEQLIGASVLVKGTSTVTDIIQKFPGASKTSEHYWWRRMAHR